MAYDAKYGKVTTERGTFLPGEPVIVFRAQDRLLPELLKIYHILCQLIDCGPEHLAMIDEAAQRVKAWQATWPGNVKTPDTKR